MFENGLKKSLIWISFDQKVLDKVNFIEAIRTAPSRVLIIFNISCPNINRLDFQHILDLSQLAVKGTCQDKSKLHSDFCKIKSRHSQEWH